MPGMPGGPVGPTRPNSPSETALSLALQAVSRRTSTPDFFLQQTAALAAEPTVTTPATTSTLIPLRHITPHLLMGMNPPSGRPRAGCPSLHSIGRTRRRLDRLPGPVGGRRP